MARRPDSPPVEDDGVTVLQDEVLALLEAAQIPTSYCDQIIHLIMMGEREREATSNLRCTACGHPTSVEQFPSSLCGWRADNGVQYSVNPGFNGRHVVTQDQLFLLTHPSNTSECCDAPVEVLP